MTPVFDDAGKHILVYVGSRGHHADIGGITPGSMPPDSTVVEEGGVLIDNFLLMEEGRLREQEMVARLRRSRHVERRCRCDPARALHRGHDRGDPVRAPPHPAVRDGRR
jgi:N-methylhydantoinase B/oxoprolinase/acetone carboxylase alpha subunit